LGGCQQAETRAKLTTRKGRGKKARSSVRERCREAYKEDKKFRKTNALLKKKGSKLEEARGRAGRQAKLQGVGLKKGQSGDAAMRAKNLGEEETLRRRSDEVIKVYGKRLQCRP